MALDDLGLALVEETLERLLALLLLEEGQEERLEVGLLLRSEGKMLLAVQLEVVAQFVDLLQGAERILAEGLGEVEVVQHARRNYGRVPFPRPA